MANLSKLLRELISLVKLFTKYLIINYIYNCKQIIRSISIEKLAIILILAIIPYRKFAENTAYFEVYVPPGIK